MKQGLPNSRLTLNQTKAGFTLIELLVVISIIAIISIIAVTQYGSIQADSRDAKRKSELEAIAAALEVNKSPGGGNYIPVLPNMFGASVFPGGITSEALDPQGYPYCISSAGTPTLPTPLPENLSGVSGWVNQTGAPDCPATPTGWVKINGNYPPINTLSWTICTRLENKGTPMALCKSNIQ